MTASISAAIRFQSTKAVNVNQLAVSVKTTLQSTLNIITFVSIGVVCGNLHLTLRVRIIGHWYSALLRDEPIAAVLRYDP